MDLERRQLFDGGLSLGALTLLTGCDVSDHDSVQRALAMMSRFNDRVQAAIFGPNKLAPTFSEGEAVKDFRDNAWYGKDKAPKLSAADYRLQLAGQIADKQPWTVEKLYRLPQVTQITRHVCVEGA
jgi:DMSO/TMAO reductase YedYZ molybdopterin-dependent catalytic subunit